MNDVASDLCPDARVTAALDAFARLGIPSNGAADSAQRAFGASRYLCSLVTRYPEALCEALADGALDAPLVDSADVDFVADIDRRVAGGESIERALRVARHVGYFRILWRMFERSAELQETFAELSALADASIRVACREARASLAPRFGVPRDADGVELPLITVAMGKLGGRELNVSSDIDLIFLHPGAGTGGGASAERTDGARALELPDWFAREARAAGGLLSRVSADGFVFRVDTRLRPFGASGPPVSSFTALEAYWHEHARDWERHAMVKARAVTGREQDIRRFESLRLPFVYRRYLDFNALPSLRDLKRLIGERDRQRGGDDVKLGRGGIREIEFLVQAFQLVRGGRVKVLRGRELLPVLTALAELGLIPADDARIIAAAYAYLRRVENGLQALDDAQTHRLPPPDSVDMARIALGLGESDAASCLARLSEHRRAVQQRFDALFDGEGIGVQQSDVPHAAPQCVVADEPDADSPIDDGLDSLLVEPAITRLGEPSRTRVASFVVAARAAIESVAPVDALATAVRVRAFVLAAAGRGGYLQVLLDRPGALVRMVRVFGASEWAATAMTRQPVLVDEVLRPGVDAPLSNAAAYRDEVDSLMEDIPADDLEAQMNSCRHLRQVHELRVALAWLDDELTIMQVSDRLSWLAEALIAAALDCVKASLIARHGRPRCRESADAGTRGVALAVIAYGKLGGLELGHGSDLDLVFLHDSAGEALHSDGDAPLDNGLWLAKLVQRFKHFMTVRTEAGLLYEIDLRLRPNGSAGLLVTSIEAFTGYQRDDAWTWEHQALLRARAVHGDEALRERFESLRVDILCRERASEALARSVAEMRARMLSVHGASAVGLMHLKRDPGGITDIEFVVQYLALAHAAAHPAIVRFSDNMRVLDAALEAGVIDAPTHACATAAWLGLRSRLYDSALQGGTGTVVLDDALQALAADTMSLRDRFLGPL